MASSSTSTRKPWKKNLYENTCYPDNYTDHTFLEELRKNINIQNVSFWNVFIGAGRVTQEFSMTIAFVLIFFHLYNDWIRAESIFIILNIFGMLCYLFIRLQSSSIKSAFVEDIKTVTVFLVFGYLSSPILHNLTDSISTDTIYIAASFAFGLHMMFYDYGISAAIVSSAISLNAAMFASICLASRLSSPYQAFVLLTLSVECFALCSVLFSKLNRHICVLLIGITVLVMSSISSTLTIIYLSALCFINVLCPILYYKWQCHKNNIYGPWDEAIVYELDNTLN